MSPQPDQRLRAKLEELRSETTLRDLAARIGISHYVLHKFLKGDPGVRPTTVARIRQWAERPGDEAVVQDMRRGLRRLLGRLGVRRALEVEGRIGEAIRVAFKDVGEEPPDWVRKLGKKQL